MRMIHSFASAAADRSPALMIISIDDNIGSGYASRMIRSFRCKETEKLFNGRFSAKLPQAVQRIAANKLMMLNAATLLDTLRVPPSNRLEKLRHDRKGRHSIRINKQWRICFIWRNSDAYEVEIVDYH